MFSSSVSEEQGILGGFKWANCVSNGKLKSECGLRWAKTYCRLLIVFLWYVSCLRNSCIYIHEYSDTCSVLKGVLKMQ